MGAGVALLLVVAVVAVLGLRDSGGRPAAGPASTGPIAAGAGSAGGGSGAIGAGSLRLPDQVGGLPRIPLGDPSLLNGQQGLLDLITRSGALDGWGVAAYGPDRDDPRFVLLVLEAKESSTAGLVAGGMVDAIRNNLGDLSEPRTFSRNGVRYECYNGSLGSLCSFQDGPTVGLGFGRDTDLDRLSQLTDEARRGVRS